MGQGNSVSDSVEKMLQEAPPGKAEGQKPASAAPESARRSSEPAPVEDPNGKADGEAKPTGESAADRSAFERELVDALPDEERKEFDESSTSEQARMMAFMKRQYRQSAKQMTELGTLRKMVGALKAEGVTQEDLVDLVQRKRGVSKPEAQKIVEGTPSLTKRGYDRWREKAQTPEEREQLTEAEQVQRELIEDVVRSVLEKEVAPLREKVTAKERQELSERQASLEGEINDLEDKLGYSGSLIETHRAQMQRLGLQEPHLSGEELLVSVAGFKAVKTALLKQAKPSETPQKAAASRVNSSIVKKPSEEPPAAAQRGRPTVRKYLDGLFASVKP